MLRIEQHTGDYDPIVLPFRGACGLELRVVVAGPTLRLGADVPRRQWYVGAADGGWFMPQRNVGDA